MQLVFFNKNLNNNFKIKAIINGDTNFFVSGTRNEEKIRNFEYSGGNCFHNALKKCQKDICLVLVNLYLFGKYFY